MVSPKSRVEGEERVFFARAEVPNGGVELRSGMQGRGKVSVGWHPPVTCFLGAQVVAVFEVMVLVWLADEEVGHS